MCTHSRVIVSGAVAGWALAHGPLVGCPKQLVIVRRSTSVPGFAALTVPDVGGMYTRLGAADADAAASISADCTPLLTFVGERG